jgi:erythromycin esterase-like protein
MSSSTGPSHAGAAAGLARPSAAEIVQGLCKHLQPLFGHPSDYDRLLTAIGTARFVLLGEASHGTREFYRERIEIT